MRASAIHPPVAGDVQNVAWAAALPRTGAALGRSSVAAFTTSALTAKPTRILAVALVLLLACNTSTAPSTEGPAADATVADEVSTGEAGFDGGPTSDSDATSIGDVSNDIGDVSNEVDFSHVVDALPPIEESSNSEAPDAGLCGCNRTTEQCCWSQSTGFTCVSRDAGGSGTDDPCGDAATVNCFSSVDCGGDYNCCLYVTGQDGGQRSLRWTRCDSAGLCGPEGAFTTCSGTGACAFLGAIGKSCNPTEDLAPSGVFSICQ
jgi:hypothetical protein